MNKTIRIGENNYGNVFCKITITDGKLSITGVEGPTSGGDCRGGCGQINMGLDTEKITLAPGWTKDMLKEFLATWDKWHLNDMRPYCVHQKGDKWNTSKIIQITKYTWSSKFHTMRNDATNGKLSSVEYEEFKTISANVMSVTIGINSVKYETPLVIELLAEDWIKIECVETKTAGWVNHLEHPDGILSKPCGECGYKYGSAWNKEELPQSVIDFLESLPVTDITPTWV